MGCLNSLVALPPSFPSSYSARDLESIHGDIDKLYRTGKFPLDRVYTKFCGYDRFNTQQVLPYLPTKWRSKYSDIVLIGAIDRVGVWCRRDVVFAQQWAVHGEAQERLVDVQRVSLPSEAVLAASEVELYVEPGNQLHLPGPNRIHRRGVSNRNRVNSSCDAFVRGYRSVPFALCLHLSSTCRTTTS